MGGSVVIALPTPCQSLANNFMVSGTYSYQTPPSNPSLTIEVSGCAPDPEDSDNSICDKDYERFETAYRNRMSVAGTGSISYEHPVKIRAQFPLGSLPDTALDWQIKVELWDGEKAVANHVRGGDPSCSVARLSIDYLPRATLVPAGGSSNSPAPLAPIEEHPVFFLDIWDDDLPGERPGANVSEQSQEGASVWAEGEAVQPGAPPVDRVFFAHDAPSGGSFRGYIEVTDRLMDGTTQTVSVMYDYIYDDVLPAMTSREDNVYEPGASGILRFSGSVTSSLDGSRLEPSAPDVIAEVYWAGAGQDDPLHDLSVMEKSVRTAHTSGTQFSYRLEFDPRGQERCSSQAQLNRCASTCVVEDDGGAGCSYRCPTHGLDLPCLVQDGSSLSEVAPGSEVLLSDGQSFLSNQLCLGGTGVDGATPAPRRINLATPSRPAECLPDGDLQFRILAADWAGNKSPAYTTAVRVDNQPAKFSLATVNDKQYSPEMVIPVTNSTSLKLSFHADLTGLWTVGFRDNVSHPGQDLLVYQCYSNCSESGERTISVPLRCAGDYRITVASKDKASPSNVFRETYTLGMWPGGYYDYSPILVSHSFSPLKASQERLRIQAELEDVNSEGNVCAITGARLLVDRQEMGSYEFPNVVLPEKSRRVEFSIPMPAPGDHTFEVEASNAVKTEKILLGGGPLSVEDDVQPVVDVINVLDNGGQEIRCQGTCSGSSSRVVYAGAGARRLDFIAQAHDNVALDATYPLEVRIKPDCAVHQETLELAGQQDHVVRVFSYAIGPLCRGTFTFYGYDGRNPSTRLDVELERGSPGSTPPKMAGFGGFFPTKYADAATQLIKAVSGHPGVIQVDVDRGSGFGLPYLVVKAPTGSGQCVESTSDLGRLHEYTLSEVQSLGGGRWRFLYEGFKRVTNVPQRVAECVYPAAKDFLFGNEYRGSSDVRYFTMIPEYEELGGLRILTPQRNYVHSGNQRLVVRGHVKTILDNKTVEVTYRGGDKVSYCSAEIGDTQAAVPMLDRPSVSNMWACSLAIPWVSETIPGTVTATIDYGANRYDRDEVSILVINADIGGPGETEVAILNPRPRERVLSHFVASGTVYDPDGIVADSLKVSLQSQPPSSSACASPHVWDYAVRPDTGRMTHAYWYAVLSDLAPSKLGEDPYVLEVSASGYNADGTVSTKTTFVPFRVSPVEDRLDLRVLGATQKRAGTYFVADLNRHMLVALDYGTEVAPASIAPALSAWDINLESHQPETPAPVSIVAASATGECLSNQAWVVYRDQLQVDKVLDLSARYKLLSDETGSRTVHLPGFVADSRRVLPEEIVLKGNAYLVDHDGPSSHPGSYLSKEGLLPDAPPIHGTISNPYPLKRLYGAGGVELKLSPGTFVRGESWYADDHYEYEFDYKLDPTSVLPEFPAMGSSARASRAGRIKVYYEDYAYSGGLMVEPVIVTEAHTDGTPLTFPADGGRVPNSFGVFLNKPMFPYMEGLVNRALKEGYRRILSRVHASPFSECLFAGAPLVYMNEGAEDALEAVRTGVITGLILNPAATLVLLSVPSLALGLCGKDIVSDKISAIGPGPYGCMVGNECKTYVEWVADRNGLEISQLEAYRLQEIFHPPSSLMAVEDWGAWHRDCVENRCELYNCRDIVDMPAEKAIQDLKAKFSTLDGGCADSSQNNEASEKELCFGITKDSSGGEDEKGKGIPLVCQSGPEDNVDELLAIELTGLDIPYPEYRFSITDEGTLESRLSANNGRVRFRASMPQAPLVNYFASFPIAVGYENYDILAQSTWGVDRAKNRLAWNLMRLESCFSAGDGEGNGIYVDPTYTSKWWQVIRRKIQKKIVNIIDRALEEALLGKVPALLSGAAQLGNTAVNEALAKVPLEYDYVREFRPEDIDDEVPLSVSIDLELGVEVPEDNPHIVGDDPKGIALTADAGVEEVSTYGESGLPRMSTLGSVRYGKQPTTFDHLRGTMDCVAGLEDSSTCKSSYSVDEPYWTPDSHLQFFVSQDFINKAFYELWEKGKAEALAWDYLRYYAIEALKSDVLSQIISRVASLKITQPPVVLTDDCTYQTRETNSYGWSYAYPCFEFSGVQIGVETMAGEALTLNLTMGMKPLSMYLDRPTGEFRFKLVPDSVPAPWELTTEYLLSCMANPESLGLGIDVSLEVASLSRLASSQVDVANLEKAVEQDLVQPVANMLRCLALPALGRALEASANYVIPPFDGYYRNAVEKQRGEELPVEILFYSMMVDGGADTEYHHADNGWIVIGETIADVRAKTDLKEIKAMSESEENSCEYDAAD